MRSTFILLSVLAEAALIQNSFAKEVKPDNQRPNIILVMSDDQGWGQTGYYNHPVLKTPNLDDMALHGLRFDRFYAGAPVCSPSRASALTGRANDRTAVHRVGYPMRRQEKTVAQALKNSGYRTAHFGKWHLDGFKGPGVPILADDKRNPGYFGFDEWLSVTNFFDMNPLMSRNGKFEDFKGNSSEIIVAEALKYIHKTSENQEPFFVVIWYGSPHNPWIAGHEDKNAFHDLDTVAQNHYGEIVEMDRSIGVLRKGLRDMKISENTLVWFNSDNGGVKNFGPETVGGLRGWKGDIYEGGLRVPCIVEWPAVIKANRSTEFPASVMDIFPTIAEIVGVPSSEMTQPIDGISIRKLFDQEIKIRKEPIPFRYITKGALIDNNFKLVTLNTKGNDFELYDLKRDPSEKNNLITSENKIAQKLIAAYKSWCQSVDRSMQGNDYPEGLTEPDPKPQQWILSAEYKPFLSELLKRPEYQNISNNSE